jgi:hypothetical protein
MKKLALILFFSLAPLICFSQVKTSGTFETGYEYRRTVIYLDPEFQRNTGWFPMYERGPFYGHFYADAELEGFKLYTSDKTWFNKDSQIYFNPQASEFIIGLSYSHNKISTGYEHMCTHSFEAQKFSDFYDRVYIKFKLF